MKKNSLFEKIKPIFAKNSNMNHTPHNSIVLFFEALKSGMLINAQTPQEVEQINRYIDEQKHLTKSFDEACKGHWNLALYEATLAKLSQK